MAKTNYADYILPLAAAGALIYLLPQIKGIFGGVATASKGAGEGISDVIKAPGSVATTAADTIDSVAGTGQDIISSFGDSVSSILKIPGSIASKVNTAINKPNTGIVTPTIQTFGPTGSIQTIPLVAPLVSASQMAINAAVNVATGGASKASSIVNKLKGSSSVVVPATKQQNANTQTNVTPANANFSSVSGKAVYVAPPKMSSSQLVKKLKGF